MILPGHGNGRIKVLAVVLILCAAASSLYGKGAREDNTLPRADELIENKAYDEAIQLLTEYMKVNPDGFGEAQARLQKIVRLREQYNQIANELLDILESDPENNEKILELSDLLLTIESPSNPTVRHFMDQVRFLAEFNVSRIRLERILAAAKLQLEQNNFSGALATYASGLDIYQALYFSSGYGQEAEDVASQGLQIIRKNIQDFNALENPFDTAVQAVISLNTSALPQPEDLLAAYSKLSPMLEELAAMRTGFVETWKSYDEQLTVLKEKYPNLGDRCFLSFAGRLIIGPDDQNEGMIGALKRFWDLQVGAVESVMANIINRSYGLGYAAMMNRDYSGGLSAFDSTAGYISTMLELLRSWNKFPASENTRIYTIYEETVIEEKAGDYLKLKTLDQALPRFREVGNLGKRGVSFDRDISPALVSWQQGAMDSRTAISREQNIRSTFNTLINELETLNNWIGSEIEIVRIYTESLAGMPGTASSHDYLAEARNVVADLRTFLMSQEYNSIVRQYTIANGDLERRTNAREMEFSEGNSLIQGIPQEREGHAAYTAYYPSEGLAVLDRMAGNLGLDIETARALLVQYAAEPRNVLDAAEVSGLNASAQTLLARLLDLQRQSTGVMASVRTQINRAASLKTDGDRLFQSAQAALNRNDFENARSFLTRAADQYDASLAIQESDSLRTYRDTQVVKLGDDIVAKENEIVTRDVRNMVTSARNSYYAGNMEQAEELLVRAQNRWRGTNVTEHQDVEYWLRLVRGALSLQSGRVIAPTAPLYAEMSQLLSDATRSYNEGVKLMSSGNRTEGRAKFNEAMDKTREIRLMFPMNHDARLLQLRIEQQIDLPAFNAAFRQRVNEAVAGTKAQNPESFAELQNLAEINPQYPGMQALLVQAEIDIGLRPPPPDPRALARSAELVRSAQTNINTRDTTRYEVARTQLEEAIRLDPNNSQAQTLMDQLSILMTGRSTIILSSYAQNLYNTAQQEYLRGNYLSANAIVEQLLQNTEYQKSIQIQELKRRIEAAL